MDGEAYFGIIKKTSPVNTLGYYFKPVIKIAQTESSRSILDSLKERYQANMSKTRVHKNPNQRPSLMIEVSHRKKIQKILDEVEPYLIVKKSQAKILRSYLNLPDAPCGIKDHHNKARLRLDAKKQILYNSIRLLNKRGLAETE